MTLWRQYTATLLIAVLTLTGHSMAIARGMSPSVDMMELCTGDTIVMVAVDAEGQPTGHSHICPEFTLMLSEAVAPVINLQAPDTARFDTIVLPVKTQADSHGSIAAVARAPPSSF